MQKRLIRFVTEPTVFVFSKLQVCACLNHSASRTLVSIRRLLQSVQCCRRIGLQYSVQALIRVFKNIGLQPDRCLGRHQCIDQLIQTAWNPNEEFKAREISYIALLPYRNGLEQRKTALFLFRKIMQVSVTQFSQCSMFGRLRPVRKELFDLI